MATRPTTTNYGIALYGPQGTEDPMDVYRVYNPAMETIDRIMGAIYVELGKLDARMTAAEKHLNQLDTRENQHYTELKNSIAETNAKIDNLRQEMNTKFEQVNNQITQLGTKTDNIWTAIQNITAKVMGGGTVDKATGTITWPQAGTIPVGNINVFSGSGYLRTRAGEQDNDVKVV